MLANSHHSLEVLMSVSIGAEEIILRLPDGLRQRIKSVSKKNQRSMNADAVFHLKRIYQPELEMENSEIPS